MIHPPSAGESATTPTAEPLSIAPWERYMALDRGPDHSMTCYYRMWFRGHLRRDDFVQALEILARRNPFMSVRWTSRHWVPVPFDPHQQVDWQDASVPISHDHLSPEDTRLHFLVREGSLRQLQFPDDVEAEEMGALLVIKYSHAVSDGMGIQSLISQMHRYWEGTLDWSQPAGDLEYRLHLGLSWFQRLARSPWDLLRIAKFMRCFPRAFRSASTPAHPSDSPPIAFVHRISSPERMKEIHHAAHERNVRVNDLLIAILFQAIAESQRHHGILRIAIPVSMRPSHEGSLCNLVSMVFLDRRRSDLASPNFLNSINREMEEIKRDRLGHAMILFLSFASFARGWLLKQYLRSFQVNVTAVLTNLGRSILDHPSIQIGGWTLLAMDSIPPLRPGTHIVLSVNRFADRLSLTCRFDPHLVDAETAHQLVDHFLLGDLSNL